MRHGFIRPPLHFTSIPFAPYYSHPTMRARACPSVCVLCVIALYFVRARESERMTSERKRKMRAETKARPYDATITPHAGFICTLLFVSLLKRRRRKKKSRWFTKPEEAADPLARFFVCLFVRVCLLVCPFRQTGAVLVRDNPFVGMNCASIHLKEIAF